MRNLSRPTKAENNRKFTTLKTPYQPAEGADVVKKAIYEQFLATEERLGVTFEYVDVNPFPQLSGLISQSINAQSNDYQLVFGGLGNIFGTAYAAKQNNFASTYAAAESAALQTLADMIAAAESK